MSHGLRRQHDSDQRDSRAAVSARWPKTSSRIIPHRPIANVFSNYSQKSVAPITNTTYSIRIDQNFSEKAKIWGSYNTRENDLFTGGLPNLPSPVSTTGWWQDFTTHFFRAGLDYTLTSESSELLRIRYEPQQQQELLSGGRSGQRLGRHGRSR